MAWDDAAQERRFKKFDLNLLRALDVLLEERNVTHAAARLCVTQPAMSATLQRMRDFFHDQLLVRVGREMELTPRARSLIAPVRELLVMARSTLDTQPSFHPLTTRQSFRIAMSDYAATILMPRVIVELAQTAPHVAVHVEALTAASFSKLSRNDLDFCLTSDDWRLYGEGQPGQDLRMEHLFTDEFVCVVDRAHPHLGQTLSLPDYKQATHAAARLGRGVSSIVERAWVLADLNLNVAVTAPSFSLLLMMIPGTPLVATTQARMAWALMRILPLRQLPCPIEIPQLREVLLWHVRSEFDPAHAFMRRVLERAAVDL